MRIWIFSRVGRTVHSINAAKLLFLLGAVISATIWIVMAHTWQTLQPSVNYTINEIRSKNLEPGQPWTLRRQEWSLQGMHGELLGPGFTVHTIEHPNKLIPPGLYPLRMTHSRKFGKSLPEVENVYRRSGIRIHAGARYVESEGCILVTPDALDLIIRTLENRRGVKLYIH